MSKGEKKPKTF